MGKYCYVMMCNQNHYYNENNQYVETEVNKLAKEVACNMSLGYYEPSALALKNIRRAEKKRKKTSVLGFEYTERYIAYDPFFIICEDKDSYFEEVITGRRYRKTSSNSYNSDNCKDLILSYSQYLPANKVADILKTLNNDEIRRIKNGLINLEKAIATGYQNDILIKKNNIIKTQNSEAYIKNFRNRYGK